MKHLILGAGNLGISLASELQGEGSDAVIASKNSGHIPVDVLNQNDLRALILSAEWESIWYAVGGLSVKESSENPDLAMAIHRRVPREILTSISRKTKLVFFSTDYVADEVNEPANPEKRTLAPRSDYARIKIEFEKDVIERSNRPNTAIVRVGSLYGPHRPEFTFPGRILKAFGTTDVRIRLPSNLITPTPTAWVARMLKAYMGSLFSPLGARTHHCAPAGNCSVKDWAKLVLSGLRDPGAFLPDEFYEDSRPHFSAMGLSFSDANAHWHDLWLQHFQLSQYLAKSPAEAAGMPSQ